MENNFFGLNGLVWWIGVVEDIDDPLKAGRCRVRILGWHPDDTNLLPVNALPWAQIIIPVTSGSGMSGVGYSPHQLIEGSKVIGFMWDGMDGQYPVIMGVIQGTGEADSRKGKHVTNPVGHIVPGSSNRPSTGNAKVHDKPGGVPPKGKYAPTSPAENKKWPWPVAYRTSYDTAGVW